ncbi:VOC family protein [Amycolatopsis sp. NPDC059021]|uniref:bleomycin resistance protein n=1 Tax=Amycolatopsis sp. NPDC059021 TaxID=3346704 RepID=UPI00366A7832
MAEKTIPLLTCRTIQPVADFYTALGFAVTMLQKSPYPYLVVERGDIELQFLGMKNYDPAESLQGCYVLTDDVDSMYAAFRSGLKAFYGRIPSRGIPRIGPVKNMSYGLRQFLMTDPGGNSIRIGQSIDGSHEHRPPPKETFAKALHMATLFADSKEDLPGAAKILDRALGLTAERPAPPQLVRLLILRADVAQRQGNAALAAELLERARATELTEDERGEVRDVLRRADELSAER